jgi:hypothetical protein
LSCGTSRPRAKFGTASLSIRPFAQSILVGSLLNLRKVPATHKEDWGREEVLMTKHRRITGFAAVALLAVAATAATIRSHSPWTQVTTGQAVDANKPANFEDRWSAMSAFSPTSDTVRRVDSTSTR